MIQLDFQICLAHLVIFWNGSPKEVLDMLLDHLPRWYPENFQVTPVSTPGQPFGSDTVVALKVPWGEDLKVNINEGNPTININEQLFAIWSLFIPPIGMVMTWGWFTIEFTALSYFQPSLFWSRSRIWGDHCFHIASPLADQQLNLATGLQTGQLGHDSHISGKALNEHFNTLIFCQTYIMGCINQPA